jgi:predicted lipase
MLLAIFSCLLLTIKPFFAYDPSKARELWNYCLASYCSESKLVGWDVTPMSLNYPGMIDVRVIYNSTGNTQAFVGFQPKENTIHVVFRGTVSTSIQDWIDDLDAIKINYSGCSGCEVHRGFYYTYLDVNESLIRNVDDMYLKYRKPLISIAGHSLGGALATYGALEVRARYGKIDQYYTFGSPRVGNEAFAVWWNSQIGPLVATYRVTHNRDPGKGVFKLKFALYKKCHLLTQSPLSRVCLTKKEEKSI